MITVTLTGETWQDIRAQMADFALDTVTLVRRSTQEESAPSGESTKRSPGRPKKVLPTPAEVLAQEPQAPPVEQPELFPAAAPPLVEGGPVTIERVKAAIRKVAEFRQGDKTATDGIQRAAGILGAVNCITVKELRPEYYEKVLALCAK